MRSPNAPVVGTKNHDEEPENQQGVNNMKTLRNWVQVCTVAAATVIMASLVTVPAGAADKRVAIKGGQIGGAFNRWTSAWSVYLSKTIDGVQFSSESSTGSPENLRAVGSGNVDFAMIFASDLYNGYRGEGDFKKKFTDIGAMSFVFASVGHFVVGADSDFKTLEDIKGKRVSLGGPGSGSATNITLLLKQAGLWDGFTPVYLGRKSPQALQNGEIAAYNWHPGLGNAMIRDTATMMNVQFIDLDEVAQKSGFYEKYPYFGKMTIPAGLYNNVDKDTATFGTGSVLVANGKVSADLVYNFLKAVTSDAGRKELSGAVGKGAMTAFTKEDAFNFITVPLHPGAERFWKEQGATIPDALKSK